MLIIFTSHIVDLSTLDPPHGDSSREAAPSLVLSDAMQWVSFHSGYDFGYLLKVLTNAELPGAHR